MQTVLDPLTDELRDFIAQRRDLALILRSPEADSLPVLTAVQGVEAESAHDLFWIAPDRFTDARSYVDGIVDTFLDRQEAMRLALAQEGLADWPAAPPSLRMPQASPVERLRQACAFSRELLPVAPQGACVWVLYPLEVEDGPGFCALMASLLQHSLPAPWCRRLRFVIRTEPAEPALAALAARPAIRVFTPDLGPQAVARNLHAVVEDENAPIGERMGTLMMLAGADQAMHRHGEALEKYRILHDYHLGMGQYGSAAVAMGGMAEAAESMGDTEQAGASYEQALILAGQEPHPPVPLFLNLTSGIGRLRLHEGRHAEGEAWFEMSGQLSVLARNAPMRLQALEQRGVCQYQAGRFAEAEESWIEGSILAAQLQEVAACRGFVRRLWHHYRQTGQVEAERERRAQLEALGPG